MEVIEEDIVEVVITTDMAVGEIGTTTEGTEIVTETEDAEMTAEVVVRVTIEEENTEEEAHLDPAEADDLTHHKSYLE